MPSEAKLDIAVTTAEKSAIQRAATAKGLTVSQYVKWLIATHTPDYPPQVERRGGDRRRK